MEKKKEPKHHYYQVRYDSHDIGILTNSLDKYLSAPYNPYWYHIGEEYKKDGKPHNQCLLATLAELTPNVRTKIREDIKKELKNIQIVHDNRCSISVAKCPYSLMNYCAKENKVSSTLTCYVIDVINKLPRKKTAKDFKDRLYAMLKSNLAQYQHEYNIAIFYEAVICFYLENDRRPPTRQSLRFLALKFRMLSIQQYLHLNGLENDHN